VLVPIVLIFVFCCGKSASKPDTVGNAKKTDAETKDDQEVTGQDEEEEEGEIVEEQAENVQPVSKSDLEEEEVVQPPEV